MRPFVKTAIAVGTLSLLSACGTSPPPVPLAGPPQSLEGAYEAQQLSARNRYLVYRRLAANQARYILQEINSLRAANGLPPLTIDTTMSRVAASHSSDMSARNDSAHTSPDGSTPDSRLRAAGVSFNAWGENIGYQTGGTTPATRMMDFWKTSTGHRANILNGNFRRIGIGVVPRLSDGTWYYTRSLRTKRQKPEAGPRWGPASG